MSRTVVLVDAVRTPFGKAGGMYAGTRADDLMVRAIRGLLERNPLIDPASIEDVAIAAATQTGDQGMNIGRSAALLSGLPNTVPGYSIDRWCAGALTAVTTIAGAIAMGANEIAIAGGVEHMGNHPMGEGMDPNPRYLAERIVEQDALAMGATADSAGVVATFMFAVVSMLAAGVIAGIVARDSKRRELESPYPATGAMMILED